MTELDATTDPAHEEATRTLMIRARPEYPVYRWSFRDYLGFPTVVVAGPDREHLWLYVHDATPTILRLHRPVVRFLRDALTDIADWFERPRSARGSIVWTLPKNASGYPECVLIASDRRVWLHVYAQSPSVVRLNAGMGEFLLEAVADLPAAPFTPALRAVSQLDVVPPWTLSEVTA